MGDHPLVGQIIAFIEASKLGIVARAKKRGPGAGAEVEEPIL
jgi:hypothetical protein